MGPTLGSDPESSTKDSKSRAFGVESRKKKAFTSTGSSYAGAMVSSSAWHSTTSKPQAAAKASESADQTEEQLEHRADKSMISE